jgi:hypothetical protein
MLIAISVDLLTVLARLLKICSLVCSGIVLVSFLLFAYDQTSGASKHQVTALAGGPNQTASGVVVTSESTHAVAHKGQPRRFIDAVAHDLTGPFRSLVQGDSQWAVWLVSTALAILVYGFGLGFAARIIRLSSPTG